ncbi:DUF2252 domain-containing protein [Pedobacter cryoconitis]|uniref:Uncharacterized protein (DUF2252 family) n=1 Tax=Pedobacter cryoconitis TaxID=188932 RepID=A0A7X0J3P4_9SPHI|nr:DUF2252 family protein [Pedobacter cryoconitis]MBB6499212.1 uncharacterized protein (DUF2252 family) [Pedobacter cryoconitis]
MNTIVDRIEKFNAPLIPDMVQLKYKAMAESPFRFFRGTCHLFYEDLVKAKGFPTSPLVWICGDLHLENFGSFKGNNRQVYFDLNDFDESMLSPLNWELARVLTSIYVAFDTLKLKKTLADEMVSAFLTKYAETLKTGKAYYIDPRTADGTVKSFLNGIELRKEKELISKITGGVKKLDIKIDNLTHFKIDKKLKGELIVHITDWLEKTPAWPNNYKVKDAAFRVAGTGSIGLKRYMFLLQGTKKKDKFLLVELKQGTTSSLAPYNKVPQPKWTSDAERMITTKYRMQNVSPALLSTTNFKDNTYVLQEMQPSADKINFESLAGNVKDLKCVLMDMAILTAAAQLRSSGIQGSAINDELTAFAHQDKWHKPLIAYATNYAEQVKKDYKEYMNWRLGE